MDTEHHLEGGTYELLRKRILASVGRLQTELNSLNEERKNVFGTIDTKVISTERVTTSNNCIPWDMHSLGDKFLFGYNVNVGLRSEVKIEDVLSAYEYREHSFHEVKLQDIFEDQTFQEDFQKLYKYYKQTRFLRFKEVGPYLHMVFRTGKGVDDLKTFKWHIEGDRLVYVDNRSDHEYRFPSQHQFDWQRTRREDFRDGSHPHISIQDRVFVECVGGDLTIKVEDNTSDGVGIYREDVEHKEQTLEDAEFHYADLGSLIVIKAKPYQEDDDRYLVFNEKLAEVERIDSIAEACVLLPDDHGLIFSDGYYLKSGELKRFDLGLQNMLFEQVIQSANGEDYLYVFYNRRQGIYLLLSYNLISQKVENPIICHGFTIFESGEMCLFKTDEDPKRHHAIQIWQTPFTGPNFQLEEKSDSTLRKIGNKEIVRAMAESQEVINLVSRDEVYADLYIDIIKKCTDILDTYYWLKTGEQHDLANPLLEIRTNAEAAVDEYEKVRKITENSQETSHQLKIRTEDTLKKAKASFANIDAYVQLLANIRTLRGEIISAKELRYIDVNSLEGFDGDLAQASDTVSASCVRFLAQDRALDPYREKVKVFEGDIAKVRKVTEADELAASGAEIADQLNLLIETVSNLKISDATETTKIIEHISTIYSQYNQIKGSLATRRKSLLSDEAKLEFEATIRLLEQSVSNYLDISDSPEQCDEYLNKLALQLEELEAKFSDFSEFLTLVEEKREEVYNAFESKKLYLTEQRNRRSGQLFSSAERILNAIRSKSKSLKTKEEVNGYFASDVMVSRIRGVTDQLVALGDAVKADDITSRLKTIKDDTLRQLRDRQDLFTEGDNIIQLGNHQFYTNTLELELSIVHRSNQLHYHLAGTDFFEAIESEPLQDLKDLWEQSLISESDKVYRAEFLAFALYRELHQGEGPQVAEFLEYTEDEQIEYIRNFMTSRYQEGYVKGIHEFDAFSILSRLLETGEAAGVLRYASEVRAYAQFLWSSMLESAERDLFTSQLKSAGIILSVFPSSTAFNGVVEDLEALLSDKAGDAYASDVSTARAARYLFEELSLHDHFAISVAAADLYHKFNDDVNKKRARSKFQKSVEDLRDQPHLAVRLIQNWLRAYISESDKPQFLEAVDEVSLLLFYNDYSENRLKQVALSADIEGLKGDHAVIKEGAYSFHLNHFLNKLESYHQDVVGRFESLQQLKKQLVDDFKVFLKLNEFKPRVLSSFVRNKLIDQVYFPLIGANLAKQIGTAGDTKRTDLMGLLLLISPPGYGKTTLMEYIASRLGIIFMKINGPAIGHEVTSLDPRDAPNAASAQELMKLNLSFEMGNNVMIYLDDIQHCNPELLQKFISMCDAQRKIEGVYKGKTRTYDFRGKKVCVVMAGNPYTESGDKFQIPDMLSNRADIYNLGDVIGDTEDVFNLSYIENCLTANPILARLVSKSLEDIYSVIKLAETGSEEGITFEANHSVEELDEYTALVRHLLQVRDVILKVNSAYIESAAITEEYRVEPAFKLQGSYRDMNKIAEKLLPMMNKKEVQTVIESHYENEAQTLTSDAEANLLKFKALIGRQTKEETQRWDYIVEKFQELQRKKGFGQNAMLAEGIADIAESMKGILGKMGGE